MMEVSRTRTKTSLSFDWEGDWMAQECTGGEMEVVGRP